MVHLVCFNFWKDQQEDGCGQEDEWVSICIEGERVGEEEAVGKGNLTETHVGIGGKLAFGCCCNFKLDSAKRLLSFYKKQAVASHIPHMLAIWEVVTAKRMSVHYESL